MLKKDFVRDGTRKIIASATTGYSDTSAIVPRRTKPDCRAHQRPFSQPAFHVED